MFSIRLVQMARRGSALRALCPDLAAIIAGLCCLLLSSQVAAKDTCGADCFISVGGRTSYTLQFDSGTTLSSVLANPAVFVKNHKRHPAFGYSNKALWLRLAPAGDEAGKVLLIENANLNHVTLYQHVEGGGWQSITMGTHHPHVDRPWRARALVFPFVAALTPGTPIFIKVESETSLFLPMYLASHEQMQWDFTTRDTLAGIFVGILLALAFYHAIIYFVVFDRSYLWFSLSTVFYVGYLACTEGFAQQWFLSTSDSGVVTRLLLASSFLSSFFFNAFLVSIMETRRYVPALHRWLSAVQWGFLLMLPAGLVISYQIMGPFSVMYATLATLIGIVVTLRLAWDGHLLARWFAVMWAAFTIASILRVLRLLGIGPAVLTGEWILQFVSASGFLFLALALAHRIRIMREAEHLALRRAMQIEQSANQQLEQKVAQRTRELRNEKHYLEYLAEVRNRFFAHANHEIRTPVTAILQYAGFLQRGVGCRPPEAAESGYLEVIHQHAERIHLLANQWLDQEKLEALESRGALASVALSPVIDNVILRMRAFFEPGVVLSVYVDPSVEKVMANVDYLDCILENLLSNAAKHTKNGAVEVRCDRNTPAHSEHQVRIQVADTGNGVPEEERHRIFQPFLQATGETRAGAGLGLATCKLYVTRMGGDIGVENTEAGGATFWFTLAVSA